MDIGKAIKKLREAQKLTQEQVANTIGLDNSSYARIEKKGNKISVDQLEKIADTLGVSVVELLTGDSDKGADNEEVKKLKMRIDSLKNQLKERDLQSMLSNRLFIVYFEEIDKRVELLTRIDIEKAGYTDEEKELLKKNSGFITRVRDLINDYRNSQNNYDENE